MTQNLKKAPSLDYKYILKNTPNLKDLPITLKKTKLKGTGIFASRAIPSGTVVALYRMKVFQSDTYDSPTNYKYTFLVYTKSGNASKAFIGDVNINEKLPLPKLVVYDAVDNLGNSNSSTTTYLPYWAHFANEPTRGVQTDNVEMDTNIEENYATRSRCKIGEYIVYKMKTTRDVKAGEELVWSYGDLYERDY
jgi:hypothetical protein